MPPETTQGVILLIFFAAVIAIVIVAWRVNAPPKEPLSDYGKAITREFIDGMIATLQKKLAYAWANNRRISAWLLKVRIANLARIRRRYEG